MFNPHTLMVLICLVGSIAHAGDDLKIDSHGSTKWDQGSSTTYVKGDFFRVDHCMGRQGICVNPLDGVTEHCGEWSLLRLGGKFFETAVDEPAAWNLVPKKSFGSGPGLVHVTLESVDTGEREVKFGYTARHIVTTAAFILSKSSCGVNETAHTYDGWYIDPPYKNKCSEFEADSVGVQYQSISDCGDAIVVERKGIKPGYGIEEKEEFVRRGETVFSHYVVDGISHGNLDPGLFAKPDTKLIWKSRNQEKERPTDKN